MFSSLPNCPPNFEPKSPAPADDFLDGLGLVTRRRTVAWNPVKPVCHGAR
jgi:hypothetical protein